MFQECFPTREELAFGNEVVSLHVLMQVGAFVEILFGDECVELAGAVALVDGCNCLSELREELEGRRFEAHELMMPWSLAWY